MMMFHSPTTLFVFVCWNFINLAVATVSNGMITIIDVAEKGVIGSAINVLIGSKDFYDDASRNKQQFPQVFLTDSIRVESCAKGAARWPKIIAYPAWPSSFKMTSADTDIFAINRD